MLYKYYFCEYYSVTLIDLLSEKKIQYRISGGEITPKVVSFTILDDSAESLNILKEISKIVESKPIISVEYTSSELNSAEFLWMWPKQQKIDIINSETAYEGSCRWTAGGIPRVMHLKQISEFTIKKEPAVTKTNALWCEDTGFAHIFVDDRIFHLIKEKNLIGIQFKRVFLKNGTPSQRLFQISSSNVLAFESVRLGYGEKIVTCPICGKEQFSIQQDYQLHLDFSKFQQDSDFYVTEPIFGDGIAFPAYIVSQRFYRVLNDAGLSGGIAFSPVIDVR